jgi:hypothetical protein
MVIVIVAFIHILRTGPEMLFTNPVYGMLVLIFIFLIMMDDDGTVRGGR